ncbi:MAG TPA: class I poly(R)-hydroxyalkanoic acid synthase [Burkholderiales bacterium]|nr:class I poly(R)-hydroxyalkanoic acid synthase [Burkholderiales bacterium]
MTDQATSSETPDALLAAIAQAGNEITRGWMALLPPAGKATDPTTNEWLQQLVRSTPGLNAEYLRRQAALWSSLISGGRGDADAKPEPGDRRFASAAWRDNPYYSYLKQSYLIAAEYLKQAVEQVETDATAKARLRFAAKQWIDAMCPANFMATNPDALREALDSGGESLARGIANLVGDANKGRISQTDESAFDVGRNLARTSGQVVYQNDLIQLIQYAPTTRTVAKRPLVMVPPCINKYYILDLQPENSFVRYAVDAGHTVFMLSWRNVGPELGQLGWDDYLEDGVFTALRVARKITRADRVNALGFCVGGTLLGAALAVLAAKGEDLVASATWLTTMLDFSEPGQIGLFIDPASVAAREAAIGGGGILPGAELAFVFSSLRANDLVWPYVVNNYLLGCTPAAFDLLYWNSDSTNLPGPMYCQYVRDTYLENRLCKPGAVVNCGVPVDLGKARMPHFILATREDHIVPWRAAYRSVHLLGGQKTFVLGASGHVAGVINPADKNRRSYWVDAGPAEYPASPEAWLERAESRPGSWWIVWRDWLEAFRGGERRAPARPGTAKYKAIEPAPGRYVKERAPAARATGKTTGKGV